jgi:hypothetical protein
VCEGKVAGHVMTRFFPCRYLKPGCTTQPSSACQCWLLSQGCGGWIHGDTRDQPGTCCLRNKTCYHPEPWAGKATMNVHTGSLLRRWQACMYSPLHGKHLMFVCSSSLCARNLSPNDALTIPSLCVRIR